jgi:membrane protease YdiL (CAAX protease family)
MTFDAIFTPFAKWRLFQTTKIINLLPVENNKKQPAGNGPKETMKNMHEKSALRISFIFLIFSAVPFILSLISGNQIILICASATVLLMLTWMVYKQEGKTLVQLGLDLRRRNIGFLALGIIIGSAFFFVMFLAQMIRYNIQVSVNENAGYLSILAGLFLLLPHVLLEELIFRGYCFKKTVDKAGTIKANLIFAFLFMVWHWIALDAWGNFGMMLGLLTTAFGHLLFSTALMKSGTLYFPIGIHLGNNWTSHYFFSSSTKGVNSLPSADSLFISTVPPQDLSQFHNVLNNIATTFICFMVFTWMIWKWKTNPDKSPRLK